VKIRQQNKIREKGLSESKRIPLVVKTKLIVGTMEV
jgi:hypothetical protein